MTQIARLTIGEASARLGVSTSTLRRYVRAGKVPAAVLPSGHLRFDVDVIAAVASQELEPEGTHVRGEGSTS